MPAAIALRMLGLIGIEHRLAHAYHRQDQKDDARNEDDAERRRATARARLRHASAMITETKKKFSPMPGASAMGYFAHSPIRIVAAPETTHVASSTAPKSSPVGFPVKSVDSTAGCTKMMYAIVRNVVMPAMTSVFVL